MGFTSSIGRPTGATGYQDADYYALDPDARAVQDFTHHDRPNTAFAYILGIVKDLWDAIAVVVNPINGVLVFKQYIDEDTTIPANYDGLTASRGVEEGILVTIAPGSRLTHIGVDPLDTDQVQVTTNMTISEFSGNYVAELIDASKTKRNTGAAATLTVPTVASESWTVGDTLTIINEGSGDITLTAAVGVTFVGDVVLSDSGAAVTLTMTEDDNWVITGETA